MADRITDLTVLERYCKGDRERMARYVAMYLEGAPALFEKLAGHIRAGASEDTARLAHGLRPQVEHMGAHALRSLLEEVEMVARTQGATACLAHARDLERLSEQVLRELRVWIP